MMPKEHDKLVQTGKLAAEQAKKAQNKD